ncbi:MAG: sodium/sugar symporter [Ekhidna sp.]|nr:sodium/sugar symporter [Ekhidna sp.]MBC6409559.1 sodium/sugar symporter [Ekhidna sp.]
MNFTIVDYIVFGIYCLLILGVGLFVSRDKSKQRNAKDYFLAGKSLPWWAIGASIIAANISAEQFIGMSGSGYVLGLAIASYEWMGGFTLLIVGKYFLPVFIREELYTIPEFIEKRFSTQLKTILAVFWISLFIFINLSSVLYLGALALQTILGLKMIYGIIGLALFAAAYSLYGGLSAVAWTDVIQVVFLVMGGLLTMYLALDALGAGEGVIHGLSSLIDATPERFHMILDKTNPEYFNLPGIWVLIGGLWVANLYYFGFNQYIIQRTLAAKSLKEAQKGVLLAGFLKLLIPFVVVIPGIACFVIVNDPELLSQFGTNNLPSLQQADKAYPWLLQFLPAGLKGIAVAALAAAIVSSLASMLNSTATIFTMDIYLPYFSKTKDRNDRILVKVGRITAVVALIIGCMMAPLLDTLDQAYQFIQEYTGIVSPGILAVFLMGLFWKKTTNKAAIWGVLLSIPVALGLKTLPDFPWMHQMGLTALITLLVIFLISHLEGKGQDNQKGLQISKDLFNTEPLFNILAFMISLFIVVLYILFW